jgi:hypothetical protein
MGCRTWKKGRLQHVTIQIYLLHQNQGEKHTLTSLLAGKTAQAHVDPV